MTDRTRQRMIFAACRSLGIDDDARRQIQLIATGKASLSAMTPDEMSRVLDALKARGFKAEGRPGRRPAAERADVRYLHVLWRLLAEAGTVDAGRDALNAFVRGRFGRAWGAVPLDVDALRDWRQISDVARALQAMCRRAGIDPERRP